MSEEGPIENLIGYMQMNCNTSLRLGSNTHSPAKIYIVET
jgi:hypothetical protein